jgi:hypothetical protein
MRRTDEEPGTGIALVRFEDAEKVIRLIHPQTEAVQWSDPIITSEGDARLSEEILDTRTGDMVQYQVTLVNYRGDTQ